MKSAVVKVRLTPLEAATWRKAAGERGISALIRLAVEKELRAREAAELEAAASVERADVDALDELLERYGSKI